MTRGNMDALEQSGSHHQERPAQRPGQEGDRGGRYFLALQTLIASNRPGMAIWREKLFAWMVRNSESPMEYFKLPANRVVELGSQLEI